MQILKELQIFHRQVSRWKNEEMLLSHRIMSYVLMYIPTLPRYKTM